jgi:hypothetical protein
MPSTIADVLPRLRVIPMAAEQLFKFSTFLLLENYLLAVNPVYGDGLIRFRFNSFNNLLPGEIAPPLIFEFDLVGAPVSGNGNGLELAMPKQLNERPLLVIEENLG